MTVQDLYPLSPTQQGMLFSSILSPSAGLFVSQRRFWLRGRIDVAAFRGAWNTVIARHAALRTGFMWEGLEQPLQVVHPPQDLPLDITDGTGWGSDGRSRIEALSEADRKTPFDLASPPLIRLRLIQLARDCNRSCAPDAEDRACFVWTNHHLLLDGWSVAQVLQEVFAIYRGGDQRLLPPPVPFRDFIAWLESRDCAASESHWRRLLKNVPAAEAARAPDDFEHVQRIVDEPLTQTLKTEAARRRVTLGAVLHGAWALTLARYGGVSDVVFGTISAGRPAELPGVEAGVGLYSSALPVRVRLDDHASLFSQLRSLQLQLAEAAEHSSTPPHALRALLGRAPGAPLFDSLLVFESAPLAIDPDLDLGLTVEDVEVVEDNVHPLTLTVDSSKCGLRLELSADSKRTGTELAGRMLAHLHTILRSIAREPEAPVSEIPTLTQEETRERAAWNATSVALDPEASLVGWFEAVVRRAPDATAFALGAERLDYRTLARRAHHLARKLRAMGVGPETVVAVSVERDLSAPVALFGIWCAGGAYLPLDPKWSEQRRRDAIAASGAAVAVGRSDEDLGLPVVLLDPDEVLGPDDDAALGYEAPPDALAYVIHTSGSTGEPKPIAVPHRQLVNRLAWMWRSDPFGADEVACQKTALTFVDALWELTGPLLRGVPTVILPDALVQDPLRLVDALAAARVSRIWLVPTLLGALLDAVPDLSRRLPSLRLWVATGEPLTGALLGRFRASGDGRLVNLYGTSEVFDATLFDPAGEPFEGNVPIGRPIDNVRLHVLDGAGREASVGAPGELWVAGHGVARGYLGRESDRFRRDAFAPVATALASQGSAGILAPPSEPRMYGTGDRARYRSDGAVELLGRVDRQVKIAGHRIELDAVERALAAHSAIRAVAVDVRERGGRPAIVAWCVPETGEFPSADRLRKDLHAELGAAMPSCFVALEELPRTTSGKLDRRALPDPDQSRPSLTSNLVRPRSPTEHHVAKIFCDVLAIEDVGVHDDFFALGGHSLAAMRALGRLREETGRMLELERLLSCPTVAGISEALAEAPQGDELESLLAHVEALDEADVLALLADEEHA